MNIVPYDTELYNEYIQRILSSRQNIKDKDVYQERHHILPKCMGGLDGDNNLIFLYAQEHYYAHKLLALENPSNSGLQYAWWNMCQCTQNGERKYNISAEEYEEARKRFAVIARENQLGEKGPNFGKKFSEEERKHMSEAHKGLLVGPANPMYGKPCSDHTKKILSEKLSGDKNPAARSVKNIETGIIFTTVSEAASWASIHRSDIAANIKGKQKSAGKHPDTGIKLHWEYIE